MKADLFKRRQRMVRLIAVGNSLSAVVQTLSSEFKCSEKTIYKDYEQMSTWAHSINQNKQLTTILRARLDYLNREAMNILSEGGDGKVLTAKDKFVKIGALNAALKITVQQIKLGQELGIIERKPEVIEIKENSGEQEIIDLSKLSEQERKSIFCAEEVLTRTEKETGTR